MVIQNKKGKSQNVIEVNEGCTIESSNTTNIQEVIEGQAEDNTQIPNTRINYDKK